MLGLVVQRQREIRPTDSRDPTLEVAAHVEWTYSQTDSSCCASSCLASPLAPLLEELERSWKDGLYYPCLP